MQIPRFGRQKRFLPRLLNRTFLMKVIYLKEIHVLTCSLVAVSENWLDWYICVIVTGMVLEFNDIIPYKFKMYVITRHICFCWCIALSTDWMTDIMHILWRIERSEKTKFCGWVQQRRTYFISFTLHNDIRRIQLLTLTLLTNSIRRAALVSTSFHRVYRF